MKQSQHFVCGNAVSSFFLTLECGLFGVKNMFALDPILPWCFLISGIVRIVFGLIWVYASTVKDYCRRKFSEEAYEKLYTRDFAFPCLKVSTLSVFWTGVLGTGGSNLSYATNVLYPSCTI